MFNDECECGGNCPPCENCEFPECECECEYRENVDSENNDEEW